MTPASMLPSLAQTAHPALASGFTRQDLLLAPTIETETYALQGKSTGNAACGDTANDE